MIQSIKITNIKKQKEITIGDTIYVIDKIDWGTPTISMGSFKVPFQIGETFSGVTVGTRDISVVGYVVADMSNENVLGMKWNEYLKKQEEKIEQSKMELDKIISIYQSVRIQAGDYFIDAIPTQPPKYSNKETENNEVICVFSLYFKCYKPMFYLQEKQISLAESIGMFHFPLILPPEKLIFGKISRRQSVLIENNGDSDCGCTIVIKASGGTVENPKVYNVNTNEYISFEDVVLNDGDYITIKTEIGEENAIKHSVSDSSNVSIVGNVTNDRKYIQINQGSNYYAYEVDDLYKNNIEVSISFMEQYFNIKGM